MLILIEGLDRTGKTTLASAIAEAVGAELYHFSKPEQHPLLEYESWLDDYVPDSGRHVVCDRYHWGETVWPTIYDRPTEYTPEMLLHTELYLESRGALMVYTRSSAESIISRLDDPYPPPEKVEPALELFRRARQSSRLACLEFDLAAQPLTAYVGRFTSVAGALEERAARRWVTSHWVGDPLPTTLLVGDRPGPSDPAQATVPFRPFGGAGVYLMRALANFPCVALTNAHDGTAPVPLGDLWERLQRPRVVALGNIADEALRVNRVPHGAVPHPQYVRRFLHDRLSAYPDLIRRAAWELADLREEVRAWRTW